MCNRTYAYLDCAHAELTALVRSGNEHPKPFTRSTSTNASDVQDAMKRLNCQQRMRFARKARWGNIAPFSEVRARIYKESLAAKKAAKLIFEKRRLALPEVKTRSIQDARLVVTTPPKILSLSENYEETLAFLMEMRRSRAKGRVRLNRNISRRWRTHIDMANIERIGPAAGLVLAAELDSFRNFVGKMESLDETWHENVRSFFSESGLFELLRIRPQSVTGKAGIGPSTRVLKYRRGSKPDGQQADELRAELEAMCGERFGPRVEVNNALCEAMTNSHHHAYPKDAVWWPGTPPGDWWATCAWTPETGTMHMMIYDQGVGIPATLPKSDHWAEAIPILDRLDPERTDAGLIEAALELRRTSTNIIGRGRGLYEMAEWIEHTQSGFLRILSGKGSVTYRPGRSPRRTNLKVPFQGTLVEWEIRRGA